MDNTIAIQFSDSILGGIEQATEAIKVIIKEPQYVHGPVNLVTLKTTGAKITTVDKPNDTVVITTDKQFYNASGDITVVYDASVGAIYGRGGFVESFTTTFTPTGLVQKLPPNTVEHFNVQGVFACDLIAMTRPEHNTMTEKFDVVGTATINIIELTNNRADAPAENFNVTSDVIIKIEDLSSVIP